VTQPSTQQDFSVSADAVPTGSYLTVLGVSPSPFSDPNSWDSITVGGATGTPFTMSGVKIQFRGAKRHFAWQFKKGPGVRGDVNTFRGTHTNPFTLTVWVWSGGIVNDAGTQIYALDQWNALQQFVSCFQYNDNNLSTATGEPNVNPVDISHPALDYLNIHQVVCEWIGAPEVDQDHSGWVKLEIGLHEFLPVVPSQNVTSTPTHSNTPIVILNRGGGTTGQAIQTHEQDIQNEANNIAKRDSLP
jgi:hypothetical protein